MLPLRLDHGIEHVAHVVHSQHPVHKQLTAPLPILSSRLGPPQQRTEIQQDPISAIPPPHFLPIAGFHHHWRQPIFTRNLCCQLARLSPSPPSVRKASFYLPRTNHCLQRQHGLPPPRILHEYCHLLQALLFPQWRLHAPFFEARHSLNFHQKPNTSLPFLAAPHLPASQRPEYLHQLAAVCTPCPSYGSFSCVGVIVGPRGRRQAKEALRKKKSGGQTSLEAGGAGPPSGSTQPRPRAMWRGVPHPANAENPTGDENQENTPVPSPPPCDDVHDNAHDNARRSEPPHDDTAPPPPPPPHEDAQEDAPSSSYGQDNALNLGTIPRA
ncbi:hypothetical protein K438DRAFT_1997122 [Mycena galopus ATCC 62051]|nr:hypothetical protein K438DRAFT_1997122 [Mycena galopus ATCC 62051]